MDCTFPNGLNFSNSPTSNVVLIIFSCYPCIWVFFFFYYVFHVKNKEFDNSVLFHSFFILLIDKFLQIIVV